LDERIPAGVVLLVISFTFLGLSYVIGVCKQLSLIAGLEESKVRDRDGLARWVGRGQLSIGLLDLVISLLLLTTSMNAVPLIVAFAVVSAGGIAVLAIGSQRYMA
jgi:hypothetical protein